MRFLKEQKHEERFNAIKEWLKSDDVLSCMMKEVYDLYEDTDELKEDLIKDYFRVKNTAEGHIIKEYSEEMLMNTKEINEEDFQRYIQINWIDEASDHPWFDEDRICEEMNCDQLYIGDGMWWDNINKKHYCEE